MEIESPCDSFGVVLFLPVVERSVPVPLYGKEVVILLVVPFNLEGQILKNFLFCSKDVVDGPLGSGVSTVRPCASQLVVSGRLMKDAPSAPDYRALRDLIGKAHARAPRKILIHIEIVETTAGIQEKAIGQLPRTLQIPGHFVRGDFKVGRVVEFRIRRIVPHCCVGEAVDVCASDLGRRGVIPVSRVDNSLQTPSCLKENRRRGLVAERRIQVGRRDVEPLRQRRLPGIRKEVLRLSLVDRRSLSLRASFFVRELIRNGEADFIHEASRKQIC